MESGLRKSSLTDLSTVNGGSAPLSRVTSQSLNRAMRDHARVWSASTPCNASIAFLNKGKRKTGPGCASCGGVDLPFHWVHCAYPGAHADVTATARRHAAVLDEKHFAARVPGASLVALAERLASPEEAVRCTEGLVTRADVALCRAGITAPVPPVQADPASGAAALAAAEWRRS